MRKGPPARQIAGIISFAPHPWACLEIHMTARAALREVLLCPSHGLTGSCRIYSRFADQPSRIMRPVLRPFVIGPIKVAGPAKSSGFPSGSLTTKPWRPKAAFSVSGERQHQRTETQEKV